MPKIIDQLENKILQEARKQFFENGLADFSLRSVARECDIAVSTIYNYFRNKEKLIESILLDDWFAVLYKMDVGIEKSTQAEEGFLVMRSAIRDFVFQYTKVWSEFHGSIYAISSRHKILLEQIKVRIEKILDTYGYSEDKYMSNVLSECILTCSTHLEICEKEYLYFIRKILNK